MIPARIVRFLEQHAVLAVMGTRDQHLVPRGHRVSGWHVGRDAKTLTALVAEEFTAGLLEALEDNRQVALTIEEFPSHETYQFKGHYLSHRSLRPDDFAVVARIREQFAKNLRPIQPDAPLSVLKDYILRPGLAVDFEVLEIYLQTPGPGAGSRLVPAAEV